MALYRRSGGFGRTFGTQPSASTASTPSLSDLMKSTTAQTAEAKQANVQRQKEVTGIYDKVAGLFAPGGSFGQGYLEQINRQKVQDVSGAEQSDISRGLFGLRNRGQEWESQVGAPARLKLEDLRTQSYASALTGKAGFLEKIENPYPDLSPLFQAAIAQSSAPSYSTIINSTPSLWSQNSLLPSTLQSPVDNSLSIADIQKKKAASESQWWANQKSIYG